MVGIKDVARQAGVSVGTVSNVLNRPERVSHEIRARVHAAIDLLGYVRSESARQLRAGHSRMLGLLVMDTGNPFFAVLAQGTEQVAAEAGLGVMVCNSAESAAAEQGYLSLFVEQRLRGVLFAPVASDGEPWQALRRANIPFVVVDRAVDTRTACSVAADDVLGGGLAGRHLLAAGHRRIAYVHGPGHLQQVRDRREGLARAVEEAGLGTDAIVDIPAERLDVSAGRDAGARLLGLSPRPTAVFCANDLLALGVMQTTFDAGVRVPDDLAVVGYDDIEFAEASLIPLTSVRHPAAEIGRLAAGLLLREIEPPDPERGHQHTGIVLRPELVVRRSSTPQP
ncbi:LacI family DNA-binding transcriptional regulator [Streptomyces omiyaensis]|uniref:LacI family DNA-binding transcriptional regulator n=1 Tax=Streptomyces omiyaensis TaxID=68247 RepID=A0ABW7BSZ5_9ACTN|nr:LacI family DNA-binding transcriptional regulator [Streptomyces omiyaensis]GGY40774.1 LacI family transcriptional regulator [Streptomyces omiyaensis]